MWYVLESGASFYNYSTYYWMVVSARARNEASERLPSAVHRDGTVRLQIVPEGENFTFEFLVALGQRCGVEVAINTSLNVGSPIVQSPSDATRLLKPIDGLIEGEYGICPKLSMLLT